MALSAMMLAEREIKNDQQKEDIIHGYGQTKLWPHLRIHLEVNASLRIKSCEWVWGMAMV